MSHSPSVAAPPTVEPKRLSLTDLREAARQRRRIEKSHLMLAYPLRVHSAQVIWPLVER
jgi:hypothetical protein